MVYFFLSFLTVLSKSRVEFQSSGRQKAGLKVGVTAWNTQTSMGDSSSEWYAFRTRLMILLTIELNCVVL